MFWTNPGSTTPQNSICILKVPYPFLLKSIHVSIWRRLCYRRKRWTRRPKFKSSTRIFALHVALIALGKVWIQQFSSQPWVDRTDWAFESCSGNQSNRKKSLVAWLVGWLVLWHINHCRLIYANSYIYWIYMICKHISLITFSDKPEFFFVHSWMLSSIAIEYE